MPPELRSKAARRHDSDSDDDGAYKVPARRGNKAAPTADAVAAADEPDAAPVRLAHVAGLDNLGNTCFMNSVLQNLCGLDALAAHYTAAPPPGAAPLTAGLRALLRAYAAAAPGAAVRPAPLHTALVKRAPRFKGFGQQDAQELLMFLLDGLQWEEVVAKRAQAAAEAAAEAAQAGADADDAAGGASSSDDAGATAAAAPAAAPPPPPPPRTFVDDFFGGMLASTIVCGTCATVSTTLEPFLDVSLSLPLPTPSEGAVGGRFFGATSGVRRSPGRFASVAATAAEARNKAMDAEKGKGSDKDKAEALAAALGRVRLSGKERKRLEKEARRNAKRERKPKGAAAKAAAAKAAAAADEAGGAAAAAADPRPVSPSPSTTTTSSSGADTDSEDGEEVSSAPPAADVAAAADDAPPDADVAAGPADAPAVIILGPPLPPPGAAESAPEAGAAGDWLDFVDDAAAAAEHVTRHGVRRARSSPASSEDEGGGESVAAVGAPAGSAAADEAGPSSPPPSPPPPPPPPPPSPTVLSCLRSFVADEALCGDSRYACAACARAAKSVRWAPEADLERVQFIPSVGNRRQPLMPDSSSSSDEDELDDMDAAVASPEGTAEGEGESGEEAAGVLLNLSSRFAAVAVDADDAGSADEAEEDNAPPPLIPVDDDVEADTAPLLPPLAPPLPPSPPPSPEPGSPPPEPASPAAAAAATVPPRSPRSSSLTAAKTPPVVLRDAVKRLRFAALPRCLVVHLKRFRQDARGRTSKISGHVAFDQTLDLSDFWSPPPPPPPPADDAPEGGPAAAAPAAEPAAAEPPPPARYRLHGVVEHSGGLHGGHYVAYVRRSDSGSDDSGGWHYASDRHVRAASAADVLGAEAYLLFYVRVDQDAAAADAQANADKETEADAAEA